jgi:hypothetical protein
MSSFTVCSSRCSLNRRLSVVKVTGAIFTSREKAEKALLSEQPPGHLIYPDHRVVEIKIEMVA